jgi:hypothetical protein
LLQLPVLLPPPLLPLLVPLSPPGWMHTLCQHPTHPASPRARPPLNGDPPSIPCAQEVMVSRGPVPKKLCRQNGHQI